MATSTTTTTTMTTINNNNSNNSNNNNNLQICSHFAQNAWKKDLCSNCFKSKEEHKSIINELKPIKLPSLDTPPPKSCMKITNGKKFNTKKSMPSVNFPKELTQIIGYGGGDWSDTDEGLNDANGKHQLFSQQNNLQNDLNIYTLDSPPIDDTEIQKLTKINTDFNMNNKNLLAVTADSGDTNIKRSFAALQLGASHKDSDGKKQTLKISVMPFGGPVTTNNVNNIKQKFTSTAATSVTLSNTSTTSTTTTSSSSSSTMSNSSDHSINTTINKTNGFSTMFTNNTSNNTNNVNNNNTSTNLIDFTTPQTTSESTTKPPVILKTIIKSSGVEYIQGESQSQSLNNSIELLNKKQPEKSLLDEISETLEKNNKDKELLTISSAGISNEPESSSVTTAISLNLKQQNDNGNTTKRSAISRHNPIVNKDQTKPKISVFSKYSDTDDSNQSDAENGSSGYYDVVDATNSYENLPDGYTNQTDNIIDNTNNNNNNNINKNNNVTENDNRNEHRKGDGDVKKSTYFPNHLLSEMFSSANLTNPSSATSYNFLSKITSDGLIVAKNSTDDRCSTAESTSSSFDYSSSSNSCTNSIDEDISSMNRSESDSGIGIEGETTNQYKNIDINGRLKETHSSDYEDIMVQDLQQQQQKQQQKQKTKIHTLNTNNNNNNNNKNDTTSSFLLDKSRELAGEPDGSADPDGNNMEKPPALPTSPPPILSESRISFLANVNKLNSEKPTVPLKPTVNIIKTFTKRTSSATIPITTNSTSTTSATNITTTTTTTTVDATNTTTITTSTTSTPLKYSPLTTSRNLAQKQVISELEQIINKPNSQLVANQSIYHTDMESHNQNEIYDKNDKSFKKGRAPNPPPSPHLSIPPIASTNGSDTNEDNKNISINNSSIFDMKMNDKYQQQQQQPPALPTSPPPGSPSPTPPPPPPPSVSSSIFSISQSSSTTATPSFSSNKTNKIKEMGQSKTDDQYTYLYTRNPTGSISKSTSPVIREKDKRERATVNPKFRSLNTFSSAYKSQMEKLRLSTPLNNANGIIDDVDVPLPPRNKNMSLSQDSLLIEEKKKKSKFSFKKFLGMSTSSSSSSSSSTSNKSSETMTSSDTPKTDTKKESKFYGMLTKPSSDHSTTSASNAGSITSSASRSTSPTMSTSPSPTKPRLIIIHPIDINKNEVEVIDKRSEIIYGKPPAPPLRKNVLDINKPLRPPPPKSAELRKKQKLDETSHQQQMKQETAQSQSLHPTTQQNQQGKKQQKDVAASSMKEDNVYANLGEIRSAIAPNKPERTASMRERETQLQITKKIKFDDGDNERNYTNNNNNNNEINGSNELIVEEKSLDKIQSTIKQSILNDGIKNSIQKMTNTIDNYLKDKLSENNDAIGNAITTENETFNKPITTTTSTKSANTNKNQLTILNRDIENRSNYEHISLKSQRTSLPSDNGLHQSPSHIVQSQSTKQLFQPQHNHHYSSVPETYARPTYSKSDYGGTRFNNINHTGNMGRNISQSYCGSEISETDFYTAYSFYGGGGGGTSEAGTDIVTNDIHDLFIGNNGSTAANGMMGGQHQLKSPQHANHSIINRLRMRKGRSVLHKNLEDNYGAVVVANHEALAQALEQLQRTTNIPIPLRPLAQSINLSFDNFTILEGVRGVVAGRRAFHPAIWANQLHVTLALSVDCNQMVDITPITEFCDLVPSHYLPLMPNPDIKMVQATISVLPRMFVDTLQSYGQMLKVRLDNLKSPSNFGGSTFNLSSASCTEASPIKLRNGTSVQNLSTFIDSNDDINDEFSNNGGGGGGGGGYQIKNTPSQIPGMPSHDDLICREVGFIMLQLVNGLKTIQSKGIEELPLSLSNVILYKDLEMKDTQAKLCVLHGLNPDMAREDEEPYGTLCQCAHIVLTQMLPLTKLTAILTTILLKDRSESLTKAKSVLEFLLWGPSDIQLIGSLKERELALQRWLDLERATILQGLIRARVELTAYDECHLMFLVRSSAKMMCEASIILSEFSEYAHHKSASHSLNVNKLLLNNGG